MEHCVGTLLIRECQSRDSHHETGSFECITGNRRENDRKCIPKQDDQSHTGISVLVPLLYSRSTTYLRAKSSRQNLSSALHIIQVKEIDETHKTLINPLAHPPNALFPMSVYPSRLLSVRIKRASNFALSSVPNLTIPIPLGSAPAGDSRVTCYECESE